MMNMATNGDLRWGKISKTTNQLDSCPHTLCLKLTSPKVQWLARPNIFSIHSKLCFFVNQRFSLLEGYNFHAWMGKESNVGKENFIDN